jgi:hypothetical protein
MTPGPWTFATAASLVAYAMANVLSEAIPGVNGMLTWLPALGAYSGKVGVASLAFGLGAAAGTSAFRRWERWALGLPALCAAATLAVFPPVTAGLAQALRGAVAWWESVL